MRGRQDIGQVRYISPERAGFLTYEAGVEQAIAGSPTWLVDNRRRNQSSNFRQQSVALFRRLELRFLRKIEREHTEDGYVPRTFDIEIDKLNTLLDRVRLNRHDQKGFEIVDRSTGQPTPPEEISSGEAELVSLGIEFISFAHDAEPNSQNILLIDEPDVHLHPDLQDRLARFIVQVFQDTPTTLILATHSTALLAGLSEMDGTNVAFMRRGDTTLSFKSVTDVDRAILPIFGAHPLSNIFNKSPILLVEGEDDERIWQQAARSSQGRIRVNPCVAGSIEQLAQYETEVRNILECIYDDAQGFSLRDRDDNEDEIEDYGPVIRMRLSCRASENLMLSNDVLSLCGTDWPALKDAVQHWVERNQRHQYFEDVKAFLDNGFKRKEHDLKNIRNILIGLMTNKPWEVIVGQAIAKLSKDGGQNVDGSLRNFLGEKVCHHLLGLGPAEES